MTVTVRTWKTKKGGSLYLDIYHRGRRWPAERLGITVTGDAGTDAEKYRIADMVRARRELELLADLHNVVAPHRSAVTLVEFCEGVDSKPMGQLLVHLRPFFGNLSIGAVTLERVEAFQAHLLKKGLKESTVNTYMTTLRAQLNRAVRGRVIAANPAGGLKRLKVKAGPPASLTEKEVERLRATPMPVDTDHAREVRRAFLFSCETGLRWSDDCSLTRSKIRELRLVNRDGNPEIRQQVEWRQTKTGDPVYVPLSAAALELIRPEDGQPWRDLVFPLLRRTSNPTYVLKAWGKAAGIPNLNFHRSRHTFPRTLLNLGVDLATVQKLMGHSRIEHTARYAQASDRNRLDAIRRMDGR